MILGYIRHFFNLICIKFWWTNQQIIQRFQVFRSWRLGYDAQYRSQNHYKEINWWDFCLKIINVCDFNSFTFLYICWICNDCKEIHVLYLVLYFFIIQFEKSKSHIFNLRTSHITHFIKTDSVENELQVAYMECFPIKEMRISENVWIFVLFTNSLKTQWVVDTHKASRNSGNGISNKHFLK